MELLDSLTAIGLTEYEAKVYLALLAENPATGYQIGKKAGVPRSMVYEALGRLSKRGAVMETIEGRATLYRPLPPDVLLDRYKRDLVDLIGGMRDGLRTLYEATDEDYVWSISGRGAALAYAGQMLREAKEELYLVLADHDLAVLRGEIEAAYQRGVPVSMLLTGEAEFGMGEVVYHPPRESELQELHDTLLVVADQCEVLIARTNGGDTPATITRSRNLVVIARQFVWMEIFTQRIYSRLGPDLLQRLDPEDRHIFES